MHVARSGRVQVKSQVFFSRAHIWRDAFCSSKKVTFQRASPTETWKLLFHHPPRAHPLESTISTRFTSRTGATKERKVCILTQVRSKWAKDYGHEWLPRDMVPIDTQLRKLNHPKIYCNDLFHQERDRVEASNRFGLIWCKKWDDKDKLTKN